MKEWLDKFNPFNSDKLFAHLDRWSKIETERPAPVLVTVDMNNLCNLNCIWCNSEYIRRTNPKEIDRKTLMEVADYLPKWGVKAVCVAGGGEPLLHKSFEEFVDKLIENKVKVGVVTNGVHIDEYIESLLKCDWVGVSVDSGRPETYKKLKGPDLFQKVTDNMRGLTNMMFLRQNTDYATNLGRPGRGHGVSYKFLMHPENIRDIHLAAEEAHSIGCTNLHIRPYDLPWKRLKDRVLFGKDSLEEFKQQLEKAREYEGKTFEVVGVTHKFDGTLNRNNNFKECYALFMTAVIEPPTNQGVNLGFCCDRRGDKNLTFEDIKPSEIDKYWKSQEHWEMIGKINPKKCPRCTYKPHNIIYEKAIKVDNMTWDFI